MKKCNLLLLLMMVLSMLLSACGTPDPFEGKWIGTFDVTEAVIQAVEDEEGSEEYIEYLQLEDLVIEVEFTFEDGKVKLEVDKDSVDALIVNLETAMYDMMDDMMRAVLLETYQEMFSDVETLDDVAALSGGAYENGQALLDGLAVDQGYTDYDTYIKESVASVSMSEALQESCMDLNVYGDYDYDEEDGTLTIYYEDHTYEEMTYKFEGENLVIGLFADGYSMNFVCKKVAE